MKNIYTLLFYIFTLSFHVAYLNGVEKGHFFFSQEMIFSYIKNYSAEERKEILKDFEAVKKRCTPLHEITPLQNPLYLATAGIPGTKKSTILESFMKRYVLDSNITYLDPDQRGLKFMSSTYYGKSLSTLSLSQRENYLKTIQNAYEKWRDASNYITFLLLENAFQKRQNIAHGTTSTAEYVPALFSKLKKSGYEIILLLCSCKPHLREDAIEYRNHTQQFYQLSPEDASLKKSLFPKRMKDYLRYADSLYLYWSNSLFEKEQLTAKLSKGKIKIYDLSSYNNFTQQFDADKEKEDPSWNELLKIYQEI